MFVELSDGASNGSDSKKLRVEEAPPSRVLHIRKLPNEATETEIIALGLPFGKVTNILTLKGKNQVRHAPAKPHVCLQVSAVTGAVFQNVPGFPGDGHRRGRHHHG